MASGYCIERHSPVHSAIIIFQYLYILFLSLFLQPLFTSSIAVRELQSSRPAAHKWTTGGRKQNTGGLWFQSLFYLFSFWVELFFLGLAKDLALILLTRVLQSSTKTCPESLWTGLECRSLQQSCRGKGRVQAPRSTPAWFSSGQSLPAFSSRF